jgi:hypothetical protein
MGDPLAHDPKVFCSFFFQSSCRSKPWSPLAPPKVGKLPLATVGVLQVYTTIATVLARPPMLLVVIPDEPTGGGQDPESRLSIFLDLFHKITLCVL